ncbi:MAG: hypothetical protein ACJ8AT_03170 [Hyalangium sp.]|uniref:hypothetical protein n=1 Tax=Hyalangium sp. TaxID=2028555 RepID=UPI00389AD94C
MSNPNTPTPPYQGLTKEQALSTMRKLQADEERNPFLMGLLHNAVADSQWLAGTPYKSPADFFCDNIQGLSRTALLRDGAVAREFSQEVVARFGVTRLEQLLAYKKAAQISLNPAEPGSTFILVPQDNGELKPKRFAGCSTRELRKALEHLRSPSTYLPIAPAHLAIYERLREVLFQRFGIRVLMRNNDGVTVLDFEGVPSKQVKEFALVLRELAAETPEQLEEEEPPQPH